MLTAVVDTVAWARRRNEQSQLKTFFEGTNPVSKLLAKVRNHRAGRGQAIEGGGAEHPAAANRTIRKEQGPLSFPITISQWKWSIFLAETILRLNTGWSRDGARAR
jgi:hypothetical protein